MARAHHLLASLVLFSLLSAIACAAAPVEVISGGKSAYVIAVDEESHAGRIGQAALLLQSVLAEATGVRLPIVKESTVKDGAPAIFLGPTRAARAAGMPVDEIRGWAFHNRTMGERVYLVGRADAVKIEGSGEIEQSGAYKAVTTLLESEAGVRFLMPDEKGIHIPRLERFAVDSAMDHTWKPVFDYVIGRTSRDRAYAVANNFFGRTPLLHTYGGHSYYSAVPAKEYGQTHPEYFALLGGVREPRGNHLCISNPDVHELMLKEMEKQLDRGFEWVELAQTDGYMPCRCDQCEAIHPDIGERLWIIHRMLAEKMLARRPGKKVMIISYGPVSAPPKTFVKFPENVVIQMCRYAPEDFAAWAPFNVEKTVYIYNWGFYHPVGITPLRTPRYVVDQARLFHANKVRGIYLCGGLDGTANGLWGLEGPSYYIYGKALGYPQLDADALLDEYLTAAFGEAAAPMRAFFKSLYERLELHSRVPVGVRGFATPEDFLCHVFSAKAITDMAANLDRARTIASDEKVKARLDLISIEFSYVRRTAEVFHLYRAYRLAPSRMTLDLLGAAVEKRRELIDGFFPDGTLIEVQGLRQPLGSATKAMVLANGRAIRAPLNWDFALLREKDVLPGVGMKRMECRRVEGIALDGRLDEPVWAEIPFEELGEIGMGALKNAGRFKAAYDERNLYFGVVCEFDSLEQMDQVRSLGRDGAVWKQENIELMIDAFGQRERYCHFTVNPTPGSKGDRRIGYIDDPLHPLYDKADASWNPDWEYATEVDRENKRWTVEIRIPFTAFEAAPPAPGTIWTMNLGRTEWPQGVGKHPYVLSLWSPNLEARSFHDRSTFGDLIFK